MQEVNYAAQQRQRFKLLEADRFFRAGAAAGSSTKQRVLGICGEAPAARNVERVAARETATPSLPKAPAAPALSPRARRRKELQSQIGDCLAKQQPRLSCQASKLARPSAKAVAALEERRFPVPPIPAPKPSPAARQRPQSLSGQPSRAVDARRPSPALRRPSDPGFSLRLEAMPALNRKEMFELLRRPELRVQLNAQVLNASAGDVLRVTGDPASFTELRERFRAHKIDVSLAQPARRKQSVPSGPSALNQLLCRAQATARSPFFAKSMPRA